MGSNFSKSHDDKLFDDILKTANQKIEMMKQNPDNYLKEIVLYSVDIGSTKTIVKEATDFKNYEKSVKLFKMLLRKSPCFDDSVMLRLK